MCLKSWYSTKRIHTNISYQCYHSTLKINFTTGSLRDPSYQRNGSYVSYVLHNFGPSLQIDFRIKPSYQRNGSYVSYVLHNFGPSLQIDFRVEPSYQRNGSQKFEIFPSSGSWERPGSRFRDLGIFWKWIAIELFSNELQAFTCIFIFTCLRIYNSTYSTYQCYVQLWAILVSVSLCPWNTQDCSLPEIVFS